MQEQDQKNQLNKQGETEEVAAVLEDILDKIKSGTLDLHLFTDRLKACEESLYPVLKERFKKSSNEDKKAIFTVISHLKSRKYISFLKDIIHKDFPGLDILSSAFACLEELDISEEDMMKASLITAKEIYPEIREMIGASLESLHIRFQTIKDCFIQLDKLVQKNFLIQLISDYKERSLLIISLLIGSGKELDEVIIDLLPSVESPEAAELLDSMMKKAENKELKKRIKRALYKLSSKGIRAEKPEKKKTVWTPLTATTAPRLEGYVSAVDTAGTQLVWIVSPAVPRGVHMAYGVVNDLEGIIDFYLAELSKKEFKNFLKDYCEKEGQNFAIAEADPEYCQFLLEKGRQKMLESGKNPPDDYLFWKNMVKPKNREDFKPPVYNCYNEEDLEKIQGLIQRTGELHALKEFSGWFIDPDDMKEYIDSIESASGGPLILSPAQKKEREEEIVKKATEEYFNEEKSCIYKERLEKMAYILLKNGREDEARLALASALAIEKKGLSRADHPFLRELIRKSIDLILSEKKERERPSLIVKP